MTLVLACDLGGSGLRAALIDEAGEVVALRAVPLPPRPGVQGVAEMAPGSWWDAFVQATGDVLADAAASGSIAAVAITAFTRSQVFLGRDGQPVRPAILWGDTRAVSIVADLQARMPMSHPETSRLNAFHPLARLYWLQQNEPDSLARTSHLIEPKDYLNFRLTGVIASDHISQARLRAAATPDGAGTDLFAALGLDTGIVPPLRSPVSITGHGLPDLPASLQRLRGKPVITMAHDSWASVVGLGAMRSGFGYNLSGTTEVLGVIGAEPAEAEGLLTVDWSGRTGEAATAWQLGGPSLCGGDTLAWLVELMGGSPDGVGAALERLTAGQRSQRPVLFLPFLNGERTPFWNPGLRGSFLGLDRSHRAVDFAWSALEGVAFVNRLVLERAEAATGRPIAELRFGGGGAANAIWRQIKADVLGREVTTVAGDEHGLSGAAIIARTALGAFRNLDSAQEALVRIAHRSGPRPAASAAYDKLYPLFVEATAVLAPLQQRLAAQVSPPLSQ
jgi:xylulokinase